MLGGEVSPHAAALGELIAAAMRYEFNGGAFWGRDFRKWMGEDGFAGSDVNGMARWQDHLKRESQFMLEVADLFPDGEARFNSPSLTVTFPSGQMFSASIEVSGYVIRQGTASALREVGSFAGNELYHRVLLVAAATAAGIPVLEGALRPENPLVVSPLKNERSSGFVIEAPAGIVGVWPVVTDEEDARFISLAGAIPTAETIALIKASYGGGRTYPQQPTDTPPTLARVRGSLLGGAVGDALGFPVEFDSLEVLSSRAGGPVRDYLPIGGLPDGAVSDDTQMTLFTAEAISRFLREASAASALRDELAEAYLDWYDTQLGGSLGRVAAGRSALLSEGWLFSRRAPGTTIMGALEVAASGPVGVRVPDAVNGSKGCGTAMRSAPFGLVEAWSPEEAYQHSVDAARITHGHETAAVSAGVFARIVRLLLAGGDLVQSVFAGLLSLEVHTDNYIDEATADAVSWALTSARADAEAGGPSVRRIEEFGGGWVAEEALGIALYCALSYPGEDQVLDALSLAVSHSGDSDSTGAICGNLLGALHGEDALPAELVARLEGLPTISRVADALAGA